MQRKIQFLSSGNINSIEYGWNTGEKNPMDAVNMTQSKEKVR